MSSTAITTAIMYEEDDNCEKYEDTPLAKWISRIFKDPGNCEDCNEPELQPFWCHNCNSERFTRNFNSWTSGHRTLDYLISEVQLAAVYFSQVIEWIPYDRFRNVSFIGSGGYANTHKAIWLDGPILSWDSRKKQWYRAKNCSVALKVMHHTRSNISDDFIKEYELWGEEHYANLENEQRHYSSSEGASNSGGGGGVNHPEAIYTSRTLPIITPKLMNKSWV
ncbi:20132_t:CDS:2 [Entrophospora sp. SA101]|nr:8049_t:CDS:2 [Entrophospora sp. SA101]CAJ0753597.1 20132_t:CDS:2 [Entrophospora sp. SA101]CAJ0921906.1 19369_t:CDS:2 [Entrophospora sp. SA101]CAJ0927203.1 14034_t:CDS:2 [Entrophospora sp. SA101]